MFVWTSQQGCWALCSKEEAARSIRWTGTSFALGSAMNPLGASEDPLGTWLKLDAKPDPISAARSSCPCHFLPRRHPRESLSSISIPRLVDLACLTFAPSLLLSHLKLPSLHAAVLRCVSSSPSIQPSLFARLLSSLRFSRRQVHVHSLRFERLVLPPFLSTFVSAALGPLHTYSASLEPLPQTQQRPDVFYEAGPSLFTPHILSRALPATKRAQVPTVQLPGGQPAVNTCKP